MKDKFKNAFRSYVFDGILLILLGIAMIVWPENLLKVLCMVIGAVIGTMGLIKIIMFISAAGGERFAGDLFVGVVQLALGVAMIVKYDFFIGIFQIIAAVILVYGAILMFVQAFMLRGTKGPLFALSLIFAILTTVLAVVIFIDPVQFASFMTQLRGAALIIEGLAMLIVLRRVRTAVKEEEQE